MKKVILLIILMLSISIGTKAQVVPFDGTLNEAKIKAKAENKMIVIMCSTTW